MRFFRSKKQIALSPNPGVYSEDDPEKIIFDNGTRLRVEANHWKTFCFILAVATVGAIYTREPAPSEVKSYGVAADVNGKPLITQLAAYKPEDQALRAAFADSVTRWFTIEPVLTDTIEHSRMALNINAVKAQMVGRASMVDRKVPRTQRNFVEVRFEMDGFSIDTAKLDLATGSVFDVHAVPPWYDDQRDAVIVVCRKAIPVTREGSGLYAVDQEQLVGLKDAVLDDLGAGLKVRLVDGLIKDVFTVWEAGTDVASCNDVACATRVAKALRRAGSTENIWVTRGSEFENVYDDPKPEVQPSRSPLIV